MAGVLPNGRSASGSVGSTSGGSSSGFKFKASVTFKGFDELLRVLEQLPKEMKENVYEDALRAGSEILYRRLIEVAPVHKGPQSKASRTYGSIMENLRRFKLKFNVPKNSVIFRVSVGDAFWGGFLDRGTHSIPATAWYRRAVKATRVKIRKTIEERLKAGLQASFDKLKRK